MQKVLSTRLPEEIIKELEDASRRLGITKKQFLEEAIHLRAAEVSRQRAHEIIERSFGAWEREESPEESIARAKESFQRAMRRYVDGPLPE